MTGLSACTVTGSIASQTLPFDLSAIGSALGLITTSTNSLATGGAVAITFSYNEGYSNTLTPSTKNKQFVIASSDIVMIPMILSPVTLTIATAGTYTFVGLGGYGTLVYSFQTNNSGGSINSSSGLYTAGATPSVVDTLKVTDSLGNTATATITVT